MTPSLSITISVLCLAIAPALGQCPCSPEDREEQFYHCANESLTTVPDCVPLGINGLTITKTDIPINRNTFGRFFNLTTVYVGYRSMDTVPPDTFQDNPLLAELSLFNMGLTYIPKDLFLNTPLVNLLNLAENMLEEFPVDTFSYLPNIARISLNMNKLSTLTQAHFVNNLALREVILFGNPWLCDCQLATFASWALTKGIYLGYSVYCENPPELSGVEVTNITTNVCF